MSWLYNSHMVVKAELILIGIVCKPPDIMAEDKDIPMLANIKEMLRLKFSPADGEADADLLLTTNDISQRIEEYNGIEMDKQSIVLMLQEIGFKCVPDAQLHFVWLLKEN